MNRRSFVVAALALLSVSSTSFADSDPSKSVFKIYSYNKESLTRSYASVGYGSAIYAGKGLVYTNSHVVLGEDGKPTGNYRVCKTTNFKEPPVCFSVGELAYYDAINDLAVLRIPSQNVPVVTLRKKELSIGDTVKVYGYPDIGGETITYTEGKISWFENGLYKIDANIDSGNSGGGVFDMDGNLVGMAKSLKVGYSTIGYVIPSSAISDFISKKNAVTTNTAAVDAGFVLFDKRYRKAFQSIDFSAPGLKLSGYRSAGFRLSGYVADDDGKFFSANFKSLDGNTVLSLNNFQYLRKSWEVGMSEVAESIERTYAELKSSGDVLEYRSSVTKFSKADAVIFTARTKESRLVHLVVRTGSWGFVQALILAKDEATLAKSLSFLKKKLVTKEFQTVTGDRGGLIALDNLYSSDANFTHIRSILWSSVLLTPYSDVESTLNTHDLSAEGISGYTFEKLFKERFSSWNEDCYFYEASIKKTDKGETYGYFFTRYDTYKNPDNDEGGLPYSVSAFFLDSKPDGSTYFNEFRFVFSKPESKKTIDDFLKKVSTSSGKLPFATGNFVFGKNYVSSPEFDFTYPATPPKREASK